MSGWDIFVEIQVTHGVRVIECVCVGGKILHATYGSHEQRI